MRKKTDAKILGFLSLRQCADVVGMPFDGHFVGRLGFEQLRNAFEIRLSLSDIKFRFANVKQHGAGQKNLHATLRLLKECVDGKFENQACDFSKSQISKTKITSTGKTATSPCADKDACPLHS